MRIFQVENSDAKVLFDVLDTNLYKPKIVCQGNIHELPLLLEDYQVEHLVLKVLHQIQENYENVDHFRSVIMGAIRVSMLPKKLCQAK